MAITKYFGGKRYVEPGIASRVIGGKSLIPQISDFGILMLIDTDSNNGFTYGSGVNGEDKQGIDSVYAFSDPSDFKRAIRGGLFWDLADYIFNPSNNGQGAPLLLYASAATTEAATILYTFTGGGINGGAFELKTISEGTGANGMTSGTPAKLRTGFAALMKQGVIDVSKFYIEFYMGTFKGLDPDGDPYGDIAEEDCEPILIAKSVEFDNVAELFAWAKNDEGLNSYYRVTSTVVAGTGVVDSADLAANNTLKLAAGGTITYNSTDLDELLSSITELQNTFFLCDKWSADADGTENLKIQTFLNTSSEFTKFMVVGGGNDSTEFDQAGGSIDIAATLNDSKAIVVHSGIKRPNGNGVGLKTLPSIYHAALVAGRLCGLEPQVPITWKDLRISALNHNLNQVQREIALDAGVLHTRFIDQLGFVVNQGINTLQNNKIQTLPEGVSFEISLMRIAAQLNKELVLNARTKGFVGNNLFNASAAEIKAFTIGYLESRTASITNGDNLILSYREPTVKFSSGTWQIRYAFEANGPVNNLFFTGVSLDTNISA